MYDLSDWYKRKHIDRNDLQTIGTEPLIHALIETTLKNLRHTADCKSFSFMHSMELGEVSPRPRQIVDTELLSHALIGTI